MSNERTASCGLNKTMAAKGKYRKLIDNTAIVAAGQLGSKVLVYLLVRLYTWAMTTEEYSVASNITEMATLLIPLISLSIGDAVFRFGMDKKYTDKDVFTSGHIAFLIGCTLFVPIIPILCSINYFDGYEWLIVLYVVASIMHTICKQAIRAEGKFKLYAVQGLLNTCVTIALNVVFLVPLQMSSLGYVLSVCIADIVSMIFIIVAAKLWRKFDLRSVNKSTVVDMIKYSIPMIPTSLSWWITNVSDRFMVTYFVGDSANGLYSAAYKIPTLLMVLSGIFINAWKHSAIDEKDNAGSDTFYEKVFDTFQSLIFMIASGIVAFTLVITNLMFDPSYYQAWYYIPVLTGAMAFFNFASFTGSIFEVYKKTVWSFVTAMTGALSNVILNLILIPKMGALGAAIATLVSIAVMFLIRAIVTSRIANFKLHIVKLLINTLILGVQIVALTLKIPFWIVVQAVCVILMIAVNGVPIVKFGVQFLKSRNKKKTEQ